MLPRSANVQLEQRIGRVHRLGQSRPVQVINFVSQGTIEEGMLSVLKFKKSLFTGALDGGEKEVFLGGSRLSRFMETVDKAASNIPVAAPEEPEPVASAPASAAETDSETPENQTPSADGAQATPPGDPWSGLIQSGLSFLQQLASGTASPSNAPNGSAALRTDKQTGETYFHLPVPKPETVSRILASAEQLMRGLAELTK